MSPSTTFLVLSLTGAMGRFHTDLDAAVPHGRPVEAAMSDIQQVLGRHDVTMAGVAALP